MISILLSAGPIVSYLLLVIYAGVGSTIFGKEALPDVLISEYFIILQLYYILCFLGHTKRIMKNRVD